MKKILSFVLAAAMLLGLTSCGSGGSGSAAAGKKYVVGICQAQKHDALDAATEGFKKALKEKLGDQVEFDEQVAAGEQNACSTIVNSFVSKKVDLILANATPALQAAAAATTTIPILGTAVTEYGVALDLKDFNGTVGGNISGTSDLAPLDQQADMVLEFVPAAKKVGLLYCSAEPNSLYQVQKVKEALEKKGLECKEFPFSEANDLSAVVTAAADYSDAIYIPTDNTAASSTGIIDGVCRPKKIPVIAGEEGICKGCGVATLSISYEQLGYKTGLMAAKILTGESKIAEMPIEYDENVKKKYNKTICEDLGIQVPDGYEAIEQ